MGVIFSLLAALSYGTADFAGGYASRENPVLGVVAVSQLFGLALVLAFVALDRASGAVAPRDVFYGAAAGLAGLGGIGLLYRGLATAEVAIVSPAAALFGAAAPVLFGVAVGERFGTLVLIGVVITLPAIAMISWEGVSEELHNRVASRREAWLTGIGSGLFFGLFFIFISRPAESSGMWPLVAARSVSIAGVFVAALVSRRSLRVTRVLPVVAVAGLLDMAANIFMVLAYRHGLVAIVVMITSIYPAQTVLLGRVIFGQRVGPIRLAGIVIAIIGVALMSVG